MGFVQLKQRMRHAIRPLFYAIIVIFVVGGAFSFSSFQKSQSGRRQIGGGKRNVPNVVVTINGKKIKREELDEYLWYISEQNYGVPVEIEQQALMTWLDMKIDDVVMAQAQADEGITVSGKEIEERRAQMVEEELAPQIEERRALAQRLQRLGLTLDQYRAQRMRDIARTPGGSDAAISGTIAREKLQEKIENSVQVTDEDVRESFNEVRARHILLGPDDLERKAVEKLDEEKADLEEELKAAKDEGKDPDPKIRKRIDGISVEKQALKNRDWDAEARTKADELLKKVKGGGDFAKLAEENSTCPSASRGGDLDFFSRGRMAKEFEEAAFSMKVGEISNVVKTDFGYHIIKVEERRDNVPEDYEEEKEMHREEYIYEQKWRAWANYQSELRKSAQVEVHDPELAAYRVLSEENDEDKAIQLLDQAVQNDPQNPGAKYELAQLWKAKDNKEKALELLQEVEQIEGAERSAELMMALGEILGETERNEEAIGYYKRASDLAAPLQQKNQYIHFRLRMAFEDLEETELVDQEQDWLDRFQEAQAERGGPMGGTFTIP